MSAAFSAIMIVGAQVFDELMNGITELSQTRKPSIPLNFKSGVIPKRVILDPFDGDKSVHSARRGVKSDAAVSGKWCNDAEGRMAQQSPRFLRPLEQCYAPLVVNSSTAWIVPCQQTQKAGQIGQGLLSLV